MVVMGELVMGELVGRLPVRRLRSQGSTELAEGDMVVMGELVGRLRSQGSTELAEGDMVVMGELVMGELVGRLRSQGSTELAEGHMVVRRFVNVAVQYFQYWVGRVDESRVVEWQISVSEHG